MSRPTPKDVALAMAAHEGTARVWRHHIDDVSLDRVVVSMEVLPEMLNGIGMVHGGVVFALADTALAYLACAGNELHVTATVAVNFLGPAKLGDTLIGTASISAREGRSAAIDVVVTGEGGRTIATCHGVSRKVGGSVLAVLQSS